MAEKRYISDVKVEGNAIISQDLSVDNVFINSWLRSNSITTGNTQVIYPSASKIFLGNPVTQLRLEGLGNLEYKDGTSVYNVYHTGNVATLTRGAGLTGSNYNVGTATTWGLDENWLNSRYFDLDGDNNATGNNTFSGVNTFTGKTVYDNNIWYNTQNGQQGLYITRYGESTTEHVKHYLEDIVAHQYYQNDERHARFKWTINNTDTESNAGANANTHTFEFLGNEFGAYLYLDGQEVVHSGNIGSYTAGNASSVEWTNVQNKPTTFTPSAHSHNEFTDTALATDLNTIRTNDEYRFTFHRYSSSASNKPYSGNNANGVITMQTHSGSGAYGKQIAFGDNDDLYMRRMYSGGIAGWKKFWHNGNLTNVSQLTNDAGYLTTEADPTVPQHVKDITTTDISNWNSNSDQDNKIRVITIKASDLPANYTKKDVVNYLNTTGLIIGEKEVIAIEIDDGNTVILDGLELHFDISDTNSYSGSGTIITDLQNGVTGSMKSGTSYSTDSGGIINFDGSSNSIVEVLHAGYAVGTGAFTLELFGYMDASSGQYAGFFSSGATAGANGVIIGKDKCWVGSGGSVKNTINYSIPTNQWLHIVFVRRTDGLTTELFVNGVSQGTATETSAVNIDSTQSDLGARYYNSTSYNLTGSIGELRFYTKELTQTDVLNNFNINKNRYGL